MSGNPASPSIRYTVDPLDLPGHKIRVTIEVVRPASMGPKVTFAMPVWTPGAYIVREYARNVRAIRAVTQDGHPLPVRKESKNTWVVDAGEATHFSFSYSVYGHELSSHGLDISPEHIYLNGAGAFCEVNGQKKIPLELEIHPPANWKVYAELPEISKDPPRFRARDFDELLDTPIDVGNPQVHTIRPSGVTHDLVFCGPAGAVPGHKVEEDVGRIVEATRKLFGLLPMDHYTFFYHLGEKSDGGLEHARSTSIVMPHTVFRPRKDYEFFLDVTCHEYFHLFNVKRIRPEVLGPFDYSRENYTHLLWLSEGTTDYYTYLLLRRAGLFSPKKYLSEVAKQIKKYREIPGRLVQSLEESSFDTWIDLYRPYEATKNVSISYYLKGGLVSLCLDLELRKRTGGTKSLDDVMRHLWNNFGSRGVGIGENALPGEVRAATGEDVGEFFASYVSGLQELDFETFLGYAGLSLNPAEKEKEGRDPEEEEGVPAYLGIESEKVRENPRIKNVTEGSPAQRSGLTPGDEIVAFDGTRVTFDGLSEALKRYAPGESAEVAFFRRGRLTSLTVVFGKAPPEKWVIKPREEATKEQMDLAAHWLDAGWKDLQG